MLNLKLTRIESNNKGVYGILSINHKVICVTLERPWAGNTINISCIPVGSYLCRPINSGKFGATYEVTEVPGRTNILFHAGNSIEDTKGCILVGTNLTLRSDTEQDKFIRESRIALKFFKSLIRDHDFILTIMDI
jgi:hypothetical protein